MKKKFCPKCGSSNLEEYEPDVGLFKCRNCGYDNLEREPFPYDIRKTQREKGRYTPYKSGGKERSRK